MAVLSVALTRCNEQFVTVWIKLAVSTISSEFASFGSNLRAITSKELAGWTGIRARHGAERAILLAVRARSLERVGMVSHVSALTRQESAQDREHLPRIDRAKVIIAMDSVGAGPIKVVQMRAIKATEMN